MNPICDIKHLAQFAIYIEYLKSVSEAAETRQKFPRARNLQIVNEQLEEIFNDVAAM
jgi:hypothetical protein